MKALTRKSKTAPAPLPAFTEAADADIVRFNDVVDAKALTVFIRETHGLNVSEFDVLLRATELERQPHD